MSTRRQFRVTKPIPTGKLATEISAIRELVKSFSDELFILSSKRSSVEQEVEQGLSGGAKINSIIRLVEALQAELEVVMKAQASASRIKITLVKSTTELKGHKDYLERMRAGIRGKISDMVEQLRQSGKMAKAVATQTKMWMDQLDRGPLQYQ